MPVSDQGVSLDRYMLIPRVLIFARRRDAVLLIQGAPEKRLWANLFNGVGGHLEPGEDVLTAARREFLEETGLTADLWLCGTLIVDTGKNPGIALYIFTGDCSPGMLKDSAEGSLHWIRQEDLVHIPVMEDLPQILTRVIRKKRNTPPFSARSYYDRDGKLQVVFS